MDSGTPSSTLWAFYDPDSSSLRTSAPSLLDDLGWTSSSLDLPRSGSMLSGRVYERPTSAPRIVESGGSSLLGTPTANVYEQEVDVFVDRARRMKERHGNGNGAGTPLSVQVKMLPTPRSSDGPKGGPNQTGDGLQPAVKALLPTPTSQAAKHGTDDRGPGTLDDHNLWSVATRLLPTPTSRDWKDGDVREIDVPTNGLLGRTASRLGATTDPPSTDGNELSDAQLPLRLTTEDD